LYLVTCLVGDGEAIKVDLHRVGIDGLGRWRRGGAEERSFGAGDGWGASHGLDDEQVRSRGEQDSADAAVGCDEGALAKGLAGGQIEERGEGGEGVADAEEEATVAEAPKVLTVIVKAPGGAGDDFAGGEFEEEGVDVAVLIVWGIVGHTGKQAANGEGEEQVLVVDVVDGEERTSREQELAGERLEAQGFEGDAERWIRAAGEERGDQEKKQRKAEEAAG
jgi:hypothetical protein